MSIWTNAGPILGSARPVRSPTCQLNIGSLTFNQLSLAVVAVSVVVIVLAVVKVAVAAEVAVVVMVVMMIEVVVVLVVATRNLWDILI